MRKKSFGTSRALVVIAVSLIAVLAVFSVYEFLRADALSSSVSQAQSQQSSLSSQLDSLQRQMEAIYSQNAVLQSQNAALLQPSATPPPSVSADPNKKVAYLTFDDGPSEQYTPAVLKTLRQLNIKATFFISFDNKDSDTKRTLLKQEADEGHAIGVHCWNHKYAVCYQNQQAFLSDFRRMESVIKEVTGITPKINRFPGGTNNTVSMTASNSILMPALAKEVSAMGYKSFDWNAGGEDAYEPGNPDRATTSAEFLQKILRDAGDNKNLVVLIHDKFDFAADTVKSLVRELKKKGYTFDVLSPYSPDCQYSFAKPREGLKDAADVAFGDVTLE